MLKQDFIDKLSAKLDEIPDLENLTIDYLNINLTDFNPDNTKHDVKYSYREYEISLNSRNKNTTELKITDTSEPFKCNMGAKDCEERGYCNGDC